MPAATYLGAICSGHSCYFPRPNIQASPDVFWNGIAAHRQSDAWDFHCCGIICHDGNLASGSSTVYVNGLQAARIGDPVDCSSVVAEGSPNIFIGG